MSPVREQALHLPGAMRHPRVEIDHPRPEQAEEILALWVMSFNPPADWRAAMTPDRLRLGRILAATDQGRVLATAQAHPLLQWFGGRPVPTAGVASVATLPTHRGGGVASRVLTELLREARSQGRVLASLYPATVPVYRRLGFEYSGVQTTYRTGLESLPAGDGAILEVPPEDDEPLMASMRRLAQAENGLTEGLDDDWWANRIRGRGMPGATWAVMTESGDGDTPDGYATFRQESDPGRWGYRVSCGHFVAHTEEAGRALLGFFRRFKGVGQELLWHGPPTEPLALLLPEQSLSVTQEFRFMSRVLDVPGALEARGYREVEGRAEIAVEDTRFPDNDGVFGVEAIGGKVRVIRIGDRERDQPAISIRGLSTMFTGYVSAHDAVRFGLAHPAAPGLDLLADLLTGPAPWTPDFF
jgi:predicted acetyltransferase